MNLKYDSDERIIYIVNEDESEEVLEADSPSDIVVSPDKTKAVYIAPLEWEALGSLYVYDLLLAENKRIIAPDNKDHIPKKVIWLDNRNLAVIIGYGFGTVSIGGNIFVYDLIDEQIKPLTKYDNHIQVTDMVLKEGILELEGIQYTDDALNEFKRFKEQITLLSIDGEIRIAEPNTQIKKNGSYF